ncbi:MAG: P-loop NTPase [Acidimicrobiales bacterium]
MPSNRVQPNWCCDVCGRSYGAGYDWAVRCEGHPVPEALEVGTLVLTNSYSGFNLDVITEVFEGLGEDHARRYRRGGANDSLYSKTLFPNRNGVINVLSGFAHSGADHLSGTSDAKAVLDLVLKAGLEPASEAGSTYWSRNSAHQSSGLVSPLSSGLRAVFDLIKVAPVAYLYAEDQGARTRSTYLRRLFDGAVNLSIEEGANAHEAAAMALRVDPRELESTLNKRQEAWWGGKDVACPFPYFLSDRGRAGGNRAGLTLSRLNKAQREAVAASGFTWQPRRDATEFAHDCMRSMTMTTRTDSRLFRPLTVAVGSWKGGVGKSTVAAALGARLARDGHRSVIIDLDLANPNQSVIFGLEEVCSDTERRLILPSPSGVDNLGVFSIGPLLKDSEALSWSAATKELFLDLLAGGLDLEGVEVVIVDLPPGDSPVLSRLSRDLDLFIGVTSGHATSLDGIGRFSRIGKQVLVENLSRCDVTVEGRVIEARLFGSAEGTLRSAEAAGLELVTSMPWAESALDLGESDEIRRLCEEVLGAHP